ncbi:UNVERIFIED_CONTAM: GTPase activating protein [Siphonaria sp. JEL0065]|nr:GTPase activating protein [Siphonaria sp. JEL0065]
MARPLIPYLPHSFQPPTQDGNTDDGGIIDYEPARVYLAKWSHELQVTRSKDYVLEAAAQLHHQQQQQHNIQDSENHAESSFSFIDSDLESQSLANSTIGEAGRLAMLKEDTAAIVSKSKQKLGVWDETVLADTGIGSFVVLSTDTTPPPPKVSRMAPLSAAEWRMWFDEYVPVPKALSQPIRRRDSPAPEFLGGDGVVMLHADEVSDSSDRDDLVDLGVGNGRIVVALSEVQRRIFVGGVEPALRGQVWRFLFGFYPWDSTHAERKAIKAQKTAEYWRMKYQWLFVAERLGHDDVESTPAESVGQDPDADMYRDANVRINKDVPRTDRGHPFYNDKNTTSFRPPGVGPFSPHQNLLRDILITYACSFEGSDKIGYVQGMSDLASIVLIVCDGDEVDAFWIFAKMMESKDICTLWEVCQSGWASGGTTASGSENEFLYFVALAILDEHRDAIVRCLMTFDELLKYINDLSNTIPINSILEAAELLYLRFRVRAASLGVLPVVASEKQEASVIKNRGKDKKKGGIVAAEPTGNHLSLLEVLELISKKETEGRSVVGSGSSGGIKKDQYIKH